MTEILLSIFRLNNHGIGGSLISGIAPFEFFMQNLPVLSIGLAKYIASRKYHYCNLALKIYSKFAITEIKDYLTPSYILTSRLG